MRTPHSHRKTHSTWLHTSSTKDWLSSYFWTLQEFLQDKQMKTIQVSEYTDVKVVILKHFNYSSSCFYNHTAARISIPFEPHIKWGTATLQLVPYHCCPTYGGITRWDKLTCWSNRGWPCELRWNQRKTFIYLTCSLNSHFCHDVSKMGSQHAWRKEGVDSECTYNRKQRNLTCSDVLRAKRSGRKQRLGVAKQTRRGRMKDEGDID